MCFSAEASFVVSAGLVVAGVATIRKIQFYSQLPFALIPVIFAIQQFAEGFVWICLTNPDYTDSHKIPIRVFLIFAQVFWPVWVPFSILYFEKNENRKKVMRIFLLMGICFSTYLLYCILSYHFNAVVLSYHIRYTIEIPYCSKAIGGIFYFVPTVITPFVSGIKRMQLFGVAIFISYLISKLFFEDFVTSVWCFFAAILSILIFSIVKNSAEIKPNLLEIVK